MAEPVVKYVKLLCLQDRLDSGRHLNFAWLTANIAFMVDSVLVGAIEAGLMMKQHFGKILFADSRW